MGLLSCHRAQAPGTRASVGALQNVGSSWTRDQTRVPCTGRWILNHWTTREVPISPLFLNDFFLGCQFFPQHFEDVILLSSTAHIFFGKVHFNLIIASLNVMSLLYDFKIFYSLNLNSLTKICLWGFCLVVCFYLSYLEFIEVLETVSQSMWSILKSSNIFFSQCSDYPENPRRGRLTPYSGDLPTGRQPLPSPLSPGFPGGSVVKNPPAVQET